MGTGVRLRWQRLGAEQGEFMRIVLLLVTLLVPACLLMCQRQTGSDPAEPGKVIYYQPQLERAKGVERQLQEDLDRRGAEIQRQIEGGSKPE